MAVVGIRGSQRRAASGFRAALAKLEHCVRRRVVIHHGVCHPGRPGTCSSSVPAPARTRSAEENAPVQCEFCVCCPRGAVPAHVPAATTAAAAAAEKRATSTRRFCAARAHTPADGRGVGQKLRKTYRSKALRTPRRPGRSKSRAFRAWPRAGAPLRPLLARAVPGALRARAQRKNGCHAARRL